jgi:outer membrane biosynthesis protein TonB
VSWVPEVPANETSREDTPTHNASKRRMLLPVIATALVVAAVVGVGVRSFQERRGSSEATSGGSQTYLQPAASAASAATVAAPADTAEPTVLAPRPAPEPTAVAPGATAHPPAPVPAVTAPAASVTTPAPAVPRPAKAATASAALTSVALNSAPPDQPSLPQATTSPSVLHEVSPDVSPAISNRIHGHVNVTVRVLVDPAGNVVGEFLEHPGPSRYFARLASNAAGEWKFAPTDDRGSRVWLLRFEFIRGGVTAHATAAR